MSVRGYLEEVLPANPTGTSVFAWAEAQGKARNTVLIQARKLGWTYDKHSDTFQQGAVPQVKPAGKDPPAAREQPATPPEGARGSRKGFDYGLGTACERTVKEWKQLYEAAPITKRVEGGDVLIYERSKDGRYSIRYEVYGL